MSYCTKQDLIDRFSERELIQLTDRTNKPASTIDDVPVTRAIADAEGLADGYIGKVYALPLAVVPPMLTKLVADIARFYLHGEGVDKDSPIRTNYTDAVAFLLNVSRGLVQLTETISGSTPAVSGGGQVQTAAPERTFSRSSLWGY